MMWHLSCDEEPPNCPDPYDQPWYFGIQANGEFVENWEPKCFGGIASVMPPLVAWMEMPAEDDPAWHKGKKDAPPLDTVVITYYKTGRGKKRKESCCFNRRHSDAAGHLWWERFDGTCIKAWMPLPEITDEVRRELWL